MAVPKLSMSSYEWVPFMRRVHAGPTMARAHWLKPLCRQEDDYGRARVMRQWGDDADAISEAIDLCPVDCIHYVPRDQLALLEFVMKSCKREDIAVVARRCVECCIPACLPARSKG